MQSSAHRILVAAALLAIFAGAFFRLHAIDRKVYGVDETVTALRVAGATLPAYRHALEAGTLASLSSVRRRYQLKQPGSSPQATVRSLIEDDPQHSPLYYLLVRAWQGFGTSILAWRSLAVLFGFALLPAVWWFAAETFDRETALAAVALVALSPFHVLFAQYNREYGLWTVLTALASAVLLVALRRGNVWAWAGYALALICGLYTDPFFLYVLVGHAAYVMWTVLLTQRARRARLRAFAVVSVAALAAYAPWLEIIRRQWHVIATTTQWYGTPVPFSLLASKWIFEIASVFFDAEYGNVRLLPLMLLVVGLAGAAALAAALRVARERTMFVGFLIAGSALPLVLGDLVFHESRSTAARYFAPAWLGLELLVAAGLVTWIRSSKPRTRAFGFVVLAALLVGGGFSAAQSGARTSWWIDSHDGPLVAIADQLSARQGATLCYVDDYETVLVLSNAIATPVRLEKLPTPGCLAIATKSDISSVAHTGGTFVLVAPPSDEAETALASIHSRTSRAHGLSFEEPQLWRFTKRSSVCYRDRPALGRPRKRRRTNVVEVNGEPTRRARTFGFGTLQASEPYLGELG